jgi:hypothetical protein
MQIITVSIYVTFRNQTAPLFLRYKTETAGLERIYAMVFTRTGKARKPRMMFGHLDNVLARR